MLIHDDIYEWKGWGGKLKLASGSCRLRIFDLRKGDDPGFSVLRPYIIVVSDTPEGRMTVKSCAGNIATGVTRDFDIDPDRMVWIEHYPAKHYGVKSEYVIPEKNERIDFDWQEGMAVNPRWRPVKPDMLEIIQELLSMEEETPQAEE